MNFIATQYSNKFKCDMLMISKLFYSFLTTPYKEITQAQLYNHRREEEI